MLQNFIVHPQGGATRRGGTFHVAEVQDMTAAVRLIPFIFAAGDSYVLEFGNLYVRFFQTNGPVRESIAVTGSSWAAGTATIVTAAHSATVGDVVVIAGMNPAGYDGTYRVTGVTATDISYALVSDPGAFVAGGTVQSPFEITSPFATADLDALTFAQQGDAMLVAHKDFNPQSLLRSGATSWAFSDITFVDGPFLLDNVIAGTTLSPSATSGTVTITASSIVGINGGVGFLATDVGRHVRIQNGAGPTWGYAVITVFTDTTHVDALVDKAFGSTGAVSTWRLGAWSDTTGFPRAVAFYQSRSAFGGTDTEPERVWWSNSFSPFDFTPSSPDGTVLPTHGVTLDAGSGELALIHWLSSTQNALFAGTLAGVFFFTGAGGLLAPRSYETGPAARIRVSDTGAPAVINGTVCYIQKQRRKVRAIIFNNDIQAWSAEDLNLFADHITRGDIKELAYADQPNSVLWCVLDDGGLVGLTYQVQNGITAWHSHVVGGTGVVVESVASIPVGTHDQVWLSVQRTVDGGTVRYIEFMEREYEPPTIREDVYYLDSTVEYKGAAATVMTGLEILEGETIAILADGSTHENKTVASGSVTLNDPATNVKMGLPYNSDMVPMRAEVTGGRATSILHEQKKVHHATVILENTVGLKIGYDADHLDEIIFRTVSDPTDAPVPLFTGLKRQDIDSPHDAEGQIYVRQDNPLPATLLGIVTELETESL
ncbi:MAG: hypothetical protein V3W44_08555 [Dehalococcoidales bacterium]